MRITAVIVASNAMHYLLDALKALDAQTHKDVATLIVDNGSSDGLGNRVRAEFPKAKIIRNVKNLGFARAANQALTHLLAHRAGDDELVLFMDPDAMLEPGCCAAFAAAFGRRPELGAVAGLLARRESLENGDDKYVVSSAGVRVTRSRAVIDDGAGEEALPQRFGKGGDAFGPSIALGCYRLRALADIANGAEIVDESLSPSFADADLAWRLRLAGYPAAYAPGAAALHRGATGERRYPSFAAAIRARRRSRPADPRMYVELPLLIAKNDHTANWLIDSPRILVHAVSRACYNVLFEPASLRALPGVILKLPRMLGRRFAAMRRAKATAKDIRMALG